MCIDPIVIDGSIIHRAVNVLLVADLITDFFFIVEGCHLAQLPDSLVRVTALNYVHTGLVSFTVEAYRA